jgi:tetratricopeptide (TPR) repeat protein
MDAIVRAVAGLLERSDPEGAITRIKAFHGDDADHDHSVCSELMFTARSALQARVYGRAAKLFKKGWDGSLEAPATDGTTHLHVLVVEGLSELTPEEQALRLRQARFADAAELLQMVSVDGSSPERLLEIGDFAFRNGHYDTAEAAFRRWLEATTDTADADTLNYVAWNLYLSGRSTDTAIDTARRSWANRQSADIADTLGRLLYVVGERDEAIAIQRRAVELATGDDTYSEALELMEAGQELNDRPAFEFFPQGKKANDAASDTTVI